MKEIVFGNGEGVRVADGGEVGVGKELEALQVLRLFPVQVGYGLHVGLQVVAFLNNLAVPLLYQCLVRRDGIESRSTRMCMYSWCFSLFFGYFSCI